MKRFKYHWTIQAQEWESQCSFTRLQIKDALNWLDDYLDDNELKMKKSEKVIFVWSCIQIAEVTCIDLPITLKKIADSMMKIIPHDHSMIKCNGCSRMIAWTVPRGLCASCQINGPPERVNDVQENKILNEK